MKGVRGAVGGAALGTASVLLTGILNIQIIGARAGAVLDMNNELVSIAEPRFPVLATLSAALLSGFVFYVVVVFTKRDPRTRVSAATGFVVTVLALAIWSFTITSEAAPVAASSIGIAPGWEGWIQEGGTSPAVHLLVLLTLGVAFWTPSSTSPHENGSGQKSEPVQHD